VLFNAAKAAAVRSALTPLHVAKTRHGWDAATRNSRAKPGSVRPPRSTFPMCRLASRGPPHQIWRNSIASVSTTTKLKLIPALSQAS